MCSADADPSLAFLLSMYCMPASSSNVLKGEGCEGLRVSLPMIAMMTKKGALVGLYGHVDRRMKS